MAVEENWTEGRVAPVGKSDLAKSYRVGPVPLVTKHAVIESVQDGKMYGMRTVAEFANEDDAQEYADWKNSLSPQ